MLGATGLARQAAFAAIASMGTLFIAVATFTPQGTTAALYYLLHSTLGGAMLFLVVDLVTDRRGTDTTRRALPPIAQCSLPRGDALADFSRGKCRCYWIRP